MSVKNYVGAAMSHGDEQVLVWERETTASARTLRRVKAPRYFYVPCEDGEYESIYGVKLQKLEFDNLREFNEGLRRYPSSIRHESDISPLFKVLMNEYYQRQVPAMNFAFFDIETDTRKALGWSTVQNPYAEINAVTIYQSWTDEFITLLLPPKGYDTSKFDEEIEEVIKELDLDFRPKFTLCTSEAQLLMKFIAAIQDADILSGWNSEFFDVPYTIQRLQRVTPNLVHKMSFIGAPPPKASTVNRFGEEVPVYKLFGRTHLDYLDLFKKFAQDVRYPTYNLGFVGEAEVKAPKIAFDGHFEDFYNTQFARFGVYNARDVQILVKINKKRKLLQLMNTMAHESTCLYENLLGTVRYVETAIVNRAHNIHNQIVPDKPPAYKAEVVDGALVLDPVPGLHDWLGSVDINSLYPSVIRALNISPEMVIGTFVSGSCSKDIKESGSRFVPIVNKSLDPWVQDLIEKNVKRIRIDDDDDDDDEDREEYTDGTTAGEYDWAGIIEADEIDHVLQLSRVGKSLLNTDEDFITFKGKDWLQIFEAQQWAISGFGTVFDQSRGLGIIPRSLEAWYTERKKLQAEKKKWQSEVKRLVRERDDVSRSPFGHPTTAANKVPTAEEMKRHEVETAKLNAEITAAEIKVEDFELMQMAKKLTLNSTYGAMLSPYFGLGLREMGASVTACGRAITKHMIQTIGHLITGDDIRVLWYNGEVAKAGNGRSYNAKRSVCVDFTKREICDVALLSDTDSCYFKTLAETKHDAIQIADQIAEAVNNTFPKFMRDTFRCSSEKYDTLIKAGREIVGRRGLFLNAKKKYTIRVVDLEGFDVFKLKMMGSELKKVDTPKVIQNFLRQLMALVLDGDYTIHERYDAHEITAAEACDLVTAASEEMLEKFVNSSRQSIVLKASNPISLGTAKGINNLDAYYAAWIRAGKPTTGKVEIRNEPKNVPGHVRAAMNYNELAVEFEGSQAKLLKSGDKGLIFYLKPNAHQLKSIAIPIDFDEFPSWFNENFSLDLRLTEQKLIDSKIERIYAALDCPIPTPQSAIAKKLMRF